MVELTIENFNEVVKNSDKPVLVDFYATWCGPCKRLAPNFEQFAQENDSVISVKANVDDLRDILGDIEIQSVPTLVLYSNGEELKRKSGYMTVDELNAFAQEA
jgi:thioredoxin 1